MILSINLEYYYMELKDITTNEKIEKSSKKKSRSSNLYTNSLLTRRVQLGISSITQELDKHILRELTNSLEGKCVMEGYIRPSSIKIVSKSGGLLDKNNVLFDIVLSCDVCLPSEGMILDCVAKNITKAGIRAEIREDPSPVVIFISRDHNYMSKYFGSIKEGQSIQVKIIGFRFELNDRYISIIADLQEPTKKKTKLVLEA